MTLGIHFASPLVFCATLESGAYETPSGATVEERLISDETRIVPFSLVFRFDLESDEPAVTAVITNAVLEGGDPFPLVVRSSSGARLANGTYQFMGDYLREIEPQGTQYLFQWDFAASDDGQVVWNGIIAWTGGHIWQITISNIALLHRASLSIGPTANGSAEISWPTNFANHVLEYTSSLPATDWMVVTNIVTVAGDRVFVAVPTDGARRFYRLRKANNP